MAYGLELQSNVAQKAAGGAKQAAREIDFIGLRQNAPLIASCKAVERFWQKAYLDELVAVGNLLGGSFCTKLFVTNQPMPKGIVRRERDWPMAAQQFLAHARTPKWSWSRGRRLAASSRYWRAGHQADRRVEVTLVRAGNGNLPIAHRVAARDNERVPSEKVASCTVFYTFLKVPLSWGRYDMQASSCVDRYMSWVLMAF